MRWTIARTALLALGLFIGSGAGTATAQEHKDAAGHAAGGHGEKAVSIFPDKADLGLWSLVVFLILFAVLAKFAWGPILQGLQKREAAIHDALHEAAKARDEAHALRAQLQQEMGQAHEKVRAIIDEAKRDAQTTADDVLAKAKADIAQERERLHREIQVETDQALQSLWARAADLATQVSARAIGRQLDGDAQRRLIDEALTDLKQAAGKGNGHA